MSAGTGYRGLFADKINPRVQAFLDKEQQLYKDKDPSIYQKTPWVRLTSNATDVYVGGEKIESDDWRLQLGSGGELLSGWSDTKNGSLYSSTSRNLPKPGITGVNVKTRGKLGSILNSTINIRVPYEGDLEYIEKFYMVPGVTCLLEWGWSDYNGDFIEIEKGDTIESVKRKGISKTLGINELFINKDNPSPDELNSISKYGSMVGVIYKFSYEAVENSGYTATVELLSESYFTVGRPISTNILPDIIVPKVMALRQSSNLIQLERSVPKYQWKYDEDGELVLDPTDNMAESPNREEILVHIRETGATEWSGRTVDPTTGRIDWTIPRQ